MELGKKLNYSKCGSFIVKALSGGEYFTIHVLVTAHLPSTYCCRCY